MRFILASRPSEWLSDQKYVADQDVAWLQVTDNEMHAKRFPTMLAANRAVETAATFHNSTFFIRAVAG